MILVYSDLGVSANCLTQLMRRLKDYPAKRVKSSSLLDHLPEARLLIIPGGRDIPYHEALKGAPNQAIRCFVEKGGAYLGICAGAYYGASTIEFEKGGTLEVCGKRELAFFPGMAIGPAYGNGTFCYESDKGSRQANLNWGGNPVEVYYDGGCFFQDADRYPGITTLATYADIPGTPAAIIKCSIGKGVALLSGVHPEYEDHLFSPILKELLYKKQ